MMTAEDGLTLELKKAQNREEIARRKLDRLQARMEKLDSALQDAKTESMSVSQLRDQITTLTAQNKQLTSEVARWRAHFMDAQERADGLDTALALRDERCRELERRTEWLSAQLAKTGQSRSQLDASLGALRERLEYLEQERHRVDGQVREQERQLDDAREALKAVRSQLMTSRRKVIDLDSLVEELNLTNEEMAHRLSEAMEENHKVDALRDALSRTTAELFEARQKLMRFHLSESLDQPLPKDGGGTGLLKRASQRVGTWLKLN